MGHGSSRYTADQEIQDPKPSRRARIRRRLRLHRRKSDPNKFTTFAAADFAGIVRIEIVKAEMKFKDRWLACLSLGERTYRTEISECTDKPVWKSEKKVVLESNGPHMARISVFETNRLSKNNLVGYCEIDLMEVLSQDSEDNLEVINLLDVSSPSKTVGSISVICYFEDPIETEKYFSRRLLAIMVSPLTSRMLQLNFGFICP